MRIRLLIYSLIALFLLASCKTQQLGKTTDKDTLGTTFNDLPTPDNVDASDGVFENKVRIFWTPTTGDYKYQIRRGIDSLYTKSIPLSKTPNRSALYDMTAIPGVLYYYWVSSLDNTGNTSEPSFFDSGFIPKRIPLASPVPINTPSENDQQLKLYWSKQSTVDQYQLQIASADTDQWTTKKGFKNRKNILLDTMITSNSFTWIPTQNIQKVNWTIRAIQENQQSYFSEVVTSVVGVDDIFTSNSAVTIQRVKVTCDQMSCQIKLRPNIDLKAGDEIIVFYSNQSQFDPNAILLQKYFLKKDYSKSQEIIFDSSNPTAKFLHFGLSRSGEGVRGAFYTHPSD